MPRNDVMLWLDLETTGSASTESIIEVGILATDTSPELVPLTSFQSLVRPTYDNFKRMSPEVRDMHTQNGLIAEFNPDWSYIPTIEEAQGAILHWLRENFGPSREHILLAGSGVSHFDRQFIRRDWPKFDRRLTYYAHDVGVMRRMLRVAGIELPSGDRSHLTHRALDDARDHAQEARNYYAYLRQFKTIATADPDLVAATWKGNNH